MHWHSCVFKLAYWAAINVSPRPAQITSLHLRTMILTYRKKGLMQRYKLFMGWWLKCATEYYLWLELFCLPVWPNIFRWASIVCTMCYACDDAFYTRSFARHPGLTSLWTPMTNNWLSFSFDNTDATFQWVWLHCESDTVTAYWPRISNPMRTI